MPDLTTTLREARVIAVVGCSATPSRTSYAISRYLKEVGYRMIPVNPHYIEIHGEPCYPDLDHLPDDARIDMVNIFRRPAHTAEMVRMVIAYAEATGTRPMIWTQLGVSTREAEILAEAAGLPYVKNRCIMVEHARLFGS
ncbi:MAG: CoA-binding protein [Rhodothermales bacterium]